MSVSIKHGILELPHELPDNFTAFSPLGGPMCPHKKKKTCHELPNNLKMPTALSPLGGLSCPHKKKKQKKA